MCVIIDFLCNAQRNLINYQANFFGFNLENYTIHESAYQLFVKVHAVRIEMNGMWLVETRARLEEANDLLYLYGLREKVVTGAGRTP